MATKQTIRRWLEKGLEMKAAHMLVVCDTFDHTDYPVYVQSGKDVREIAGKNNGPNMTRLMEVYNLSMSIEDQLKQHRAFNY